MTNAERQEERRIESFQSKSNRLYAALVLILKSCGLTHTISQTESKKNKVTFTIELFG